MIKFKYICGQDGYEQAKDLRYRILNDEMGFSEAADEHEKDAIHIIGRENDVPMCYGRLYKIADYTFIIDKICVKKEDRLQYVGDTILRALEDRAVSEIGIFIYVTSPAESKEFFLHEGYVELDEQYEQNGKNFTKMKKDLTKVRGCRGGCHK